MKKEDKMLAKENKELIKKYPFLLVRNRFSGKVQDGYDYTWTELDAMPEGWRKAFGLKMCEELKVALGDLVDKYRIMQIKEKFGELRWYDAGSTKAAYDVISKYTKLSRSICIECGEPATKITTGWISPYCDEHFPGGDFIPVSELEIELKEEDIEE